MPVSFLTHKWFAPVLIFLCCIGLNVNTLPHEYALDDEMVLKRNLLVHQGFAGLGDILSQDAYKSYFSYMGSANTNLSGGRYRPLSIASFAVEQQLFGETLGTAFLESKAKLEQWERSGASGPFIQQEANRLDKLNKALAQEALKLAPVRHFFQIIYYGLCCLALYWFLLLFFGQYKWLPLFATLLFVFHPVHTEVVANVKSRDEIFSLFFILMTCSFFVKYFRERKTRFLLLGLVGYYLAFLSKEYAFALVGLLPLIYYLQHRESVPAILQKGWFLGLSGASAVFLLIRYAITKGPRVPITEVLNDPYLYATLPQKAASILAVWLEYLRLLFFPASLSSDYSYNTFPYLTFSAPVVWLSVICWVGILVLTVWLALRRHILSFALVWFLSFFVLVNNLFFDIGATMGERLIFHSSVGFCVLAAYGLLRAAQLLPLKGKQMYAATLLLVLILVPFGAKTIQRNKDWKSDFTLFTTDVHTVPNSALANNNAGTEYFNKGHDTIGNKVVMSAADSLAMMPYVKKAIFYQHRAIAIHPNYINAHVNRALCYLFLGKLDSAVADWKFVASIFPGRNPHLVKHAQVLLDKGMAYGNKKDFASAIRMMEPASAIDPVNPLIWNNLGGAYYMSGRLEEARGAFTRALQLNPNLLDARNGYNAANARLNGQ